MRDDALIDVLTDAATTWLRAALRLVEGQGAAILKKWQSPIPDFDSHEATMKKLFPIAFVILAILSLLGSVNAQENAKAAAAVAQSASPAMPKEGRPEYLNQLSDSLGYWTGHIGGDTLPRYSAVDLMVMDLSADDKTKSVAIFGWQGSRMSYSVHPDVTWQGDRLTLSFSTSYGHNVVLTLVKPGEFSGSITWPGIPVPFPISFRQQ